MNYKKPWKTKIERDIIMHDDIRVSGLQGGKILGHKLALFSLIMGIPLLLIGLYGLISMILDLGFPNNTAILILVLVVIALGCLFTIGGYFLYKGN
jgi:hypothetical protein